MNAASMSTAEQDAWLATVPGAEAGRQLTNEELEALMANFYRRKLLAYYLVGIGGMAACAFGLLGNAVSFIVILHRSLRRSSTYAYLAALAVCDALFIVSTMFLLLKDVQAPSPNDLTWPWGEGMFPYVFPYAHPTAFTLHVISIWLTVAFTVDRYIMICHPFAGKLYCTRRRAVYVIVALYAAGFLLHVPKYYEYETVHIPLDNTTTRVGCDLTPFGLSYAFRQVFHSWFYLVFVCALPFHVIAILNGFLIAAVKKSVRVGRELWAAKDKRTDTTVMLIGVVIIFFVCQTPALVSRLVWAAQDDVQESNRSYVYIINEIGTFLVILNASVNILPYFFFGRRFRTLFFHMFCRCTFRRFYGESIEYSDLRPQNHRFSTASMTATTMLRKTSAAVSQQQNAAIPVHVFATSRTSDNENLANNDNGSENGNGNCVSMTQLGTTSSKQRTLKFNVESCDE